MSEKMNGVIRGLISGGLFFGFGALPVRAQNPPPGGKADQQEHRAEAQRLRQQTVADRARLRADTRQFGPHSPQVQADREQLWRDREARRHLKRDRRWDRRIRRHRRHRDSDRHT